MAVAQKGDAAKAKPSVVLVKNATVWTLGPQGTLAKGDVLIREGKIAQVGVNLSTPGGATVIDASGKHVTPGLIDCHSHSAIRGGVNEGSNNITAEVRISDVIDPEDIFIYRQLAGGLTAANLLHGSANAIGGQNAVVKLKWKSTREAMLISTAPPGIKFALGENPKQSNFSAPGRERRYPATRMGVEESIRERFLAARAYAREWGEYNRLSDAEKSRREPPRRDLQLDAIAEILSGQRLVHSHSYRQDEILALIRLAEDFGFHIATFQHVLEGYKVADEMAAHGAAGSTFSDWWAYKLEAYDAVPYNGALMARRGVIVSFNSDSSELARRMNFEAAKAVKYGGLDEVEALKFVALNSAKQLRIDDRVGSLEPGKDADFVIWSGHPFSVYTVAEQTWVDGVKEFDRTDDLAQRPAVDQERAALIEKIKKGDKKPESKPEAENRRAGESGKSKTSERSAAKTTAAQESSAKVAAKPAPAAKSADAAKPKRPIPPAQPVAYHDRLALTGGPFAIVGATVHTITGGTIENGTVIFEKGKITALGAGLTPPKGATVVDGKGKHVYPGMIAANSVVGLTEIGSVSGGTDTAEIGALNPNIRTEIAVNPDSELIPVTRANGITHVLTVPSGGYISGTSALIRLDGWTWEDMAAGAPVAMHIQWPRFRTLRGRGFSRTMLSEEEDPSKAREKALKTIRQAFEDARAYQKAKNAGGKRGAKPVKADSVWEAMIPVLEGKVPVIVHADELRQIKSAVEWAEEEGVRMILAGAGDVWRAADLLRGKQIPVIVTGILAAPTREDEPYDTAYAVAAKLQAAGVSYCIAGAGGSFDAPNTRNLPYHAGMAAAFGLPREEALKAVTLYPAQILGVSNMLGSVEVGKSASLILTDGDPLEIRTKIIAEFIDGRPVALENNKHYRLYEKYSNRPKLNTHP
jgi:imidazolonepropionase-like amidohydrolase